METVWMKGQRWSDTGKRMDEKTGEHRYAQMLQVCGCDQGEMRSGAGGGRVEGRVEIRAWVERWLAGRGGGGG